MDTRETKTITLPVSSTVVVAYTYLTGADQLEIETAIAAAVEVSKAGAADMKAGEAYRGRVKALVDQLVVTVAGETDKAKNWATLQGLRSQDWQEVMTALEKAAAGMTAEEAKK
ncbi:MAG TPA: hypothetical protein VIG74_00705 [Alphaproteobacteria bacterium]|jgi:hypothetical protein